MYVRLRGASSVGVARLPEHCGARDTPWGMAAPYDQRSLDRVLAWLSEHDPEALAAVADVDRTLIRATLALPPFERLDRAIETATAWRRFEPRRAWG